MKKGIIIIIVTILIFNLLLVLKPTKSILVEGATNISTFSNDFFIKIQNIPQNFQTNKNLVSENKKLEKQNEKLKLENNKLENEKEILNNDNQQLKQELKIDSTNKLKSVTAQINYRKINSWNQKINIDRGSEDGILENQLVTSNNILIGVITKVEKKSSEVTLLTSENQKYNIPVKVIHGDKTYDALLERYDPTLGIEVSTLNAENSISKGDKIYTNGYGKNQSENVYVGEINKTNKEEGINQKYYVNAQTEISSYIEVIQDEK